MLSRNLVNPDLAPLLTGPSAPLRDAPLEQARADIAQIARAFARPTPDGMRSPST